MKRFLVFCLVLVFAMSLTASAFAGSSCCGAAGGQGSSETVDAEESADLE